MGRGPPRPVETSSGAGDQGTRWALLEGRMLFHADTNVALPILMGAHCYPPFRLMVIPWWRQDQRSEVPATWLQTCIHCNFCLGDTCEMLGVVWFLSRCIHFAHGPLHCPLPGNQCWEQWITTQCNPDRHFQQNEKSLYNFLTFI